jgi:hypothetical protein
MHHTMCHDFDDSFYFFVFEVLFDEFFQRTEKMITSIKHQKDVWKFSSRFDDSFHLRDLVALFFDLTSNLLKKLSFDDELIQSYFRKSDLIIHDIIKKKQILFWSHVVWKTIDRQHIFVFNIFHVRIKCLKIEWYLSR